MRETPLTDREKTDKGLYGSYAPRVGGRGVTAQSKGGPRTRRGGGAAMNSTVTELEFTRRRAMRGIVKIFVIAVFAAAILALVTATPSEAKRRPTIDTADRCIGGAGDKGCGGLICYCCYDDGCWICDKDYGHCTWDDKYRTGRPPVGPKSGVMPPGGVPPAVAPTTNVPPGRVGPQVAPGVQPTVNPPPLVPAPQRIAPGVTAPAPAVSALPGQFLIQTSRGYYLTAVGGGGRITDVVHTDATQPRSPEKFRLIPYPQAGSSYTPGSFAIQTASGNYLTAVSAGGRTTDVFHTDATQIGSWEKFSLRVLTTPGVYGAYAIWTGNGRNYVTATGGGGHNTDPPAVHTDATKVGSWETFWLLASGDPGSGIMYRISTRPGSYLIATRGGGQTTNAIGDTSTSPPGWSDEQTRFRPIRQGDGSYALQTIDGHFVTAVSGGGRDTDVLHTDATQVQAWEKFWLRDQGNGTYTIQTVKGNYLGPGPEGISTKIGDLNSAYKFRLIMYNF